MIDLDRFQNTAGASRGDAPIALADNKTGVTVRTGRVARWLSNFRAAENRDVAAHFVVSLRSRFGGEVSEQALRSTGLDQSLTRGKPLRARHVQAIVQSAEQVQADFNRVNVEAGRPYAQPVSVGANRSMLNFKIDHHVKTLYADLPQVTKWLDVGALGGRVQDEFAAAGRDGKHFVTTKEAVGIVDSVVTAGLESAAEARAGELRRLSLNNPDSPFSRALSEALATSGFKKTLRADRLTADAKDFLERRIQEIVDHELPLSALQDEAVLKAAADRPMADFVLARDAAARAVEALPLDPPAREALVELALHDNMPAALVPELAGAAAAVRDELAALGEPRNAAELQAPLAHIQDRITGAFSDAGTDLNTGNQDALHRATWRFLVRLDKSIPAQAIAGRFEHAGSPLRGIGEGANWYRHEFPRTRAAQRNRPTRDYDAPAVPLFTAESHRRAGAYSAMLGSLVDVLRESPGGAHGELELGARDTLSDDVIATLRNLGVSMPASDRIGESNRMEFSSGATFESARREVAAAFDYMMDSKVENGVVKKAIVDFNRATYRIGDTVMPSTQEGVIEGMRAFCRDKDGNLNEQMLRSVSALANQNTILAIYGICLEPSRSDVALIGGMPVVIGGLSYNLSLDRGGNVVLNVQKAGSPELMSVADEQENSVPVALDPDRSRLDLKARIRLDAATWRPELENIDIAYSLFPSDREL